ncbi:T7-like phage exonuclease [Lysobacter capsici AZ78]|uniref:T7-like phage exonuclease n=1 Tax=Lysobacter capsici AZ78 TaxID=1444315 RepID=A0A108U724_9GAMM|nr:phage exonuclease [Lysobacter capsici]KWS03739.1 T7-like phage exonuclease [Lysobacter capsici AZ78]
MKRKPLTLLIDADVFRHQLAYGNTKSIDWDGDGDVTEILDYDRARDDLDGEIDNLVRKFKATDFVLALSCPEHNFRKDVLSSYKQLRHEKPRPTLWHFVDECIREKYQDKVVMRHSLEGDDILGTLATHPAPRRAPNARIVVSIDKDLRTIPCRLFNPQKPDLGTLTISEHDANLFWMKQTLTGDSTDGYIGCRGIGLDKADKALMPVHEQYRDAPVEKHLAALWAAVVKTYEAKKFTAADALTQARLARILRHGDLNYKTNEVLLWKPSSPS